MVSFARDSQAMEQMERYILPAYVRSCRWFAGKARKITTVCVDSILSVSSPFESASESAAATPIFHLVILKAKYRTGKLEQYLLPLALITADQSANTNPKGIIAATRINEADMMLIDAIYDPAFRSALFHYLFHSSKLSSQTVPYFRQRQSIQAGGFCG